MRFLRSPFLALLLVSFTLMSCRSAGEFSREPEALADRSALTFKSMMSDPQYPGLVDLATRAKAVIIVPNLGRGAFLIGGRLGNAVMVVRDEQGMWSPPAFYTLGGLSFGLQIGGQTSEMVIAVMTDKGLNAVMERQVTLGGDAGLAVGELGKGINAATGLGLSADMYAFARSEGLFVGVSLQGSIITPRNTWNKQLYGLDATPKGILVDRTNTSSDPSIANIISVMP